MAKGKKTFIFYSDWINMVREMPDKDAGELLKHILSYVNDENPNTDNLLVKMAFGHMKPMLKNDLDKWENIRQVRREAGSKGGKANAKQNKANAKQVEAVNVNVNVNDNKKKNIEERKREFANSLAPYVQEFGRKTVLDFYSYWAEHGEKDRKFRKEKEKSFSIGRRLRTWKEREKNFSPKKEKEPTINRQTEEVIRSNAEPISIDFIDKIRNQNKT